MRIPLQRTRVLGLAAMAVVLLLQAVNSFGCYQHDLLTFLKVTAIFLGIPLLLPAVALFTRNPLLAPWLVLAFYTDCIRPYGGGGASMVYVAVLLWGSVSSLLGFVLTPFLVRHLGIEVTPG